jgi:DMSO reductase anchor subunit
MEKKARYGTEVFLVLFPAAVGCLLGGLILDSYAGAGKFSAAYLSAALALTLMGVVAPLLSIRKPLRAYRMLAGINRSPLSRQAAFVLFFMVSLVVNWAFALGGVHFLWLAILTVVLGAGAVLMMGITYWLWSQPAWRHWSTVALFFAGLLGLGVSLSMVVSLGWRSGVITEGAATVGRVLVLVGIALLVPAAGRRAAYLDRSGGQTASTRRSAIRQGRGSFIGGVLIPATVAGAAAAASFAVAWLAIVTVLSLGVGLIVACRLFTASATLSSWQSEINWARPRTLAGEEA